MPLQLLGFSPSQPQPAASTTGSRASATMFFLNYQLTKENLSSKTDNICIDYLYQPYRSIKGARKCFQLMQNEKNFFFPKPLQFRKFRKKFLNPYHLGTLSDIFPKL